MNLGKCMGLGCLCRINVRLYSFVAEYEWALLVRQMDIELKKYIAKTRNFSPHSLPQSFGN